jgi:hypothetical protein
MYGGYVQVHNISQKGYYINPLVMTMQKQTVKKIQPGEYCYMKNR